MYVYMLAFAVSYFLAPKFCSTRSNIFKMEQDISDMKEKSQPL